MAAVRPPDDRANGAPWLTSDLVALAQAIFDSHAALLGHALVAVRDDSPAAVAEALYRAEFALLCHDGAADPLFIYANQTAQRLWQLDWGAFVGMPSRLSAEPDARAVRAAMLARVDRHGYVDDYEGVRVDSRGRRFRIEDACIWNVTDDAGRLGQAARIGRWVPVD